MSVFWIGAPAIVFTVVLATLLILWLFPNGTVDRTLHLPLPHYPPPELQVSPRQDMDLFREQEAQQRVSIDRAMRPIAANGIEGWPPPAAQGTPK